MIAGHYRLVEHIGSGAMGIVWRAIDERLERSVAVKQILTQPGLSESERAIVRQRAMREAKNAARFQHPNAIVVFDIAEHEGDPCLVMEYLPSQSLSAILAERGTLPVAEVARIGEQVAAALVAAHRAGIVHRDIKPGNILIDDNGVAKIMDFGISRASGDLTLTQTGLIGGTPAYLAPELARGADPKPASDVFSLGATLYHSIEGLPPYGDSTNQLALLYAAASGKLNPPTRSGPATALLMSLLRSEPEERPSMAEARDRLAALAAGESNGKALGATLVSPPLGLAQQGGPKPVTPASASVTPPWQRNQAPSGPPRNPTTAGTPVPPPQEPAGSGGSRRKPLVFGAIGAAVVVIAVVLAIVLTSSGNDENPNAGGNSQTQAPQTSTQTSPTSPTSPSQAAHSGSQVDWKLAGGVVEAFYTNPAGSWSRLSPAGKAAYDNDPEEFAEYWEDHTVRSFRGISAYKRENNPDGSVDMQLTVDIGDGPQVMTMRVIDSGGTLLIDGNTRPDNSSSG
ncbi:serine/threonine protein kinase [Prauserella sp. PE36]|uniref:non-specific serine/threonine protein kinase n=1 Tax=Prauserella endophytica TaxID=1592324 RepID=A0ABY2S2H5_9PSEU|nr:MULTISPECIES: serine/threonine-protein kinase [Prauserella]RBM11687.1 serine/threonine protein kinase [Prauserella sp. PE36]TKG69646.1 serine/threonine protein kinase [Prauserella endophytica]